MKALFCIISTLTLLFCSCTSVQKNNPHYFPVDSIRLLVADTAFFGYENWQEHQYTNQVIRVAGEEVGFVDSTGKAAHQPLQSVLFTKAESDTLLSILFKSINTQLPPTTCIHFYRYVFLCYHQGKMVKQISLDTDCASLYVEPEKQTVDIGLGESNKQLLSLFKKKKVYLYGGSIFWGAEKDAANTSLLP